MGVWMRHCVAVTPVAPILDLTACMLSHPPMVRSWSSVTANRIFGSLCTRDPAAAPAALARSGRQRAERVAGAAPAGASRRPWPWTLLLDPPAAGSGGTSGSAGCQPRHLAPPVANARNSEIGHVDRWSKFPLQCDSRLTGNLHLKNIHSDSWSPTPRQHLARNLARGHRGCQVRDRGSSHHHGCSVPFQR